MGFVAVLLAGVIGLFWVPVQSEAPASGEMSRERRAAVDRIFSTWDGPDSPGCAVALMREGRLLYSRGYGMANLDHDVSISPSTVFHVASVSKQFTAAAVLLLAQDGKLSLDDEVAKYLPQFPDFGVPITLRHLIHHTSGLRDQWELLRLAGWRYSRDLITDGDVLELVSRQRELNFPPGEEYLYSNTGYTLLAQVVERVSGRSFRQFTRDRIFEPLGMKDTHFRDDHAEIVKGQAYGYNPSRNQSFRLNLTQFDTVGATSLLTTVEDLARWDANFYSRKLGGEEFVGRLTEPGRLNGGETLDYACGLMLGRYRGRSIVEHSGGDAGYRAHYLRFPEQRFSVAVFCNAGAAAFPPRLARRVADLFLREHLQVPEDTLIETPDEISLPIEKLTSHVGLYWNPEKKQFRRVSLRGDRLYVDDAGIAFEIRPLAQGRFRLSGRPVELRFEHDSNAEGPVLIEIASSGRTHTFGRVEAYRPRPEDLQDYAGTFLAEEIDALYRISPDGLRLLLKHLKTDPIPLTPVTRDVFVGSWGTAEFTRDEEDLVDGFLLSGERVRNLRFKRYPVPR